MMREEREGRGGSRVEAKRRDSSSRGKSRNQIYRLLARAAHSK